MVRQPFDECPEVSRSLAVTMICNVAHERANINMIPALRSLYSILSKLFESLRGLFGIWDYLWKTGKDGNRRLSTPHIGHRPLFIQWFFLPMLKPSPEAIAEVFSRIDHKFDLMQHVRKTTLRSLV